MSQEMEDSAIFSDTCLRNEDTSTATLFPAKAKRSIKFIVSLNGSLTGPRDFVYYGTDLDAHVPALATNSIRLCGESDDIPPGKDILTYPGNHQQIASVSGLHAYIIEDRSPLLAAAFESSSSGQRLHLETLCSHTVMPFLRFLYTGSYSTTGEWEDVPSSVLLHCRMYHLGDLYDLLELKSQAYVNVLRQCEYGCSSPEKPIDLCEAIDFAYKTLPGHDTITDAIVQYCVTRCLSHKLHEDVDFRDLAFSVRAFHQDLTRVCRDRGYEDESSAIIIQLPYKNYAPDTYASTENPPIAGFTDIIHHFHSSDKFDDDTLSKKRRQVTLEGKRAYPIPKPRISESSSQTENATPVTAQVEARPAVNNVALPIRQPKNSQAIESTSPEEAPSFYQGIPLRFRRPGHDLAELGIVPPDGFFGPSESCVGHEHGYPLNGEDWGHYEDNSKRRLNEMAGLAHDVESENIRHTFSPSREKHARHSQVPVWQDRPPPGVSDVTTPSCATSYGSMKCEPGSITEAIETQVKRQKTESQHETMKGHGPSKPWWRTRVAYPQSHYRTRFDPPPVEASRDDKSEITSCMSVAGSEDSDLPPVPRFTLSNVSPNPGAELFEVTPRTSRHSPEISAIADSVDHAMLSIAGYSDGFRKLSPQNTTEATPGNTSGSSLLPVIDPERFNSEPSITRTDAHRRSPPLTAKRRIQRLTEAKRLRTHVNLDHVDAEIPESDPFSSLSSAEFEKILAGPNDSPRQDDQIHPMRFDQYLRTRRERLGAQGKAHVSSSASTQKPTEVQQTEIHEKTSHVKTAPTANDHENAAKPAAPKQAPASSGNYALQDYQMQLMLLEQQRKKRALMGRHKPAPARAQKPVEVRQTPVYGNNNLVDAADPMCDLDPDAKVFKYIEEHAWQDPDQSTVPREQGSKGANTSPMGAAKPSQAVEAAPPAAVRQADAASSRRPMRACDLQLKILELQRDAIKTDPDCNAFFSMSQTEVEEEISRVLSASGKESDCDGFVPQKESGEPSTTQHDKTSPASNSDLPSTGSQNEAGLSAEGKPVASRQAVNDSKGPASESDDVEMCDSDNDSDISWVDVNLAAGDSAQQQAAPYNSSSAPKSTAARRPSSPSDSEWDFC